MRRMFHYLTNQSGHLQYHSRAGNGQAGVRFLINRKWKDPITRVNRIRPRVAELVVCITYCYKHQIVQYMHQQHHIQKKT